ncbi:MAG: hypothetical protein SCK28_14875 [Bacillota bacterium]|nr:hypothetical protein [Bacillota bacterium]
MLNRLNSKINRSVVGRTASQLGSAKREEQSGIVKSELKRKRINGYKFNQSGSLGTEDI